MNPGPVSAHSDVEGQFVYLVAYGGRIIRARNQRQAVRAGFDAAREKHRRVEARFQNHGASPGDGRMARRIGGVQGTTFRIRLREKVRVGVGLDSFDRLRLKKRWVERILSNAGSSLVNEPAKSFRTEPPVHDPFLTVGGFQSGRG